MLLNINCYKTFQSLTIWKRCQIWSTVTKIRTICHAWNIWKLSRSCKQLRLLRPTDPRKVLPCPMEDCSISSALHLTIDVIFTGSYIHRLCFLNVRLPFSAQQCSTWVQWTTICDFLLRCNSSSVFERFIHYRTRLCFHYLNCNRIVLNSMCMTPLLWEVQS